MSTQYVITDRVSGDHWALQISDSQLQWNDLGVGGSPSSEPIFRDAASGGHYVKLFISNGSLGLESTATVRNDNVTLQDLTMLSNLWTLGSSDFQLTWTETSPTPRLYNRFKKNVMSGLFDASASGSHALKVILINNSYTFNSTHNIYGDISQYEITGTGYTTGGLSVSGLSVSQDDTYSRGVFLASSNAVWNNSSLTARYAIIYDNTMINKDLVCCVDFLASYTSTNETFQLTWGSSGILLLE